MPGGVGGDAGSELTSEITLRRGSSHNQTHATGAAGPIPGPLYYWR